jgi:flagellar biosynthesis component FlhA
MLFSKNSGKKEKILGYYILVFLVLCIAGLLRTILVNDKLIPFLFIFSIILSMSIIFYSFYIV